MLLWRETHGIELIRGTNGFQASQGRARGDVSSRGPLLRRTLSDQLGHFLVVQSARDLQGVYGAREVTRPDEADFARSIRFLVILHGLFLLRVPVSFEDAVTDDQLDPYIVVRTYRFHFSASALELS